MGLRTGGRPAFEANESHDDAAGLPPIPVKDVSFRTPVLFATVVCALCGCRQTEASCQAFQGLVQATYDFKPAQLSGAEQAVHAAALDTFWIRVKAKSRTWLPCLRAGLTTPQDSGLFLVDGSNLLLSLDSSSSANALQVRAYTSARLDDIDLATWVGTLAQRGADGFDVSIAGDRWLHYPNAHYYLPEHGAYEVQRLEGALYLYGSMPESLATPALLRLVTASRDPAREDALYLLMSQATPEALRALRALPPATLSDSARAALRRFLTTPPLFERRRGKPGTTRAEFLSAFHSLLAGDAEPFVALADSVPDGERDVVTVMGSEDLPILREVRRRMIAAANQHASDYYDSFTRIILTLIWQSH